MPRKPIRLFPVLAVALLLFCGSAATVSARTATTDDVRQWLALRAGSTTAEFASYRRFLERHPDWPESRALVLHAERALLRQNPDAAILLAWFDRHKPVTDEAALRYLQVLAAHNRNTQAAEYLRDKWREGAFNTTQQDTIRAAFPTWLRSSDHEARLDRLIWDGKLDRAEKALTYVARADLRAAGTARIALQRGTARGLVLMESLPASVRQENGVIFDLARYYRQKGQDKQAAAVLARRNRTIDSNAAKWWRERNLLARRAFERNQHQQAYILASSHGHSGGIELAEAEWFAGWVALTRLKKPAQALGHFEHMYRNVKSPISRSRAAYWAGIAAGQTGKAEQADQWYRLAARHAGTFYGQMAAYALGNPNDWFASFFQRNQPVPSGTDSRLRTDLVEAARILDGMNKERERDLFLRAALRDAQGKDIPHLMIPVARRFRHHAIALAAAKAAYDRDILVADALFPRIDIPASKTVDRALTLSIIRQESMFDPLATSTANARGLMQILPSTATHVARRQGIAHKHASQLYQPRHNMILGQAYLGQLLQRYDGFVPLAAAAYNAGPGNVAKWLDTMGDPRRDPYSWVDWVERIPFYETRNYVQRVWENYAIYRYLAASR